jgi:hypothetical protein
LIFFNRIVNRWLAVDEDTVVIINDDIPELIPLLQQRRRLIQDVAQTQDRPRPHRLRRFEAGPEFTSRAERMLVHQDYSRSKGLHRRFQQFRTQRVDLRN